MFSTTPVYDGQKKLYSVDELSVEEIESEVPFFFVCVTFWLMVSSSWQWVVIFEGSAYRIRVTRVGDPIDTRYVAVNELSCINVRRSTAFSTALSKVIQRLRTLSTMRGR